MVDNISPTVSIIIPVYNCEKYIEDCLRSVKNQTYQNIHVIIIDDNSNDKSNEIIKNFISNDFHFSYTFIVNKKNLGLSVSRNIGIKYVTQDYIYFMDSDDIIPPYAIRCLVNLAIKYNNAEIIYGNHFKFNCSVSYFPYDKNNNSLKNIVGRNTITKYIFKEPKQTHTAWNQLIKTDWLISNKLFFAKNINNEDLCWNFFAVKKLKQIVCADIITYYYRQNVNGIMASMSSADYADNLEKIVKLWLQKTKCLSLSQIKYILKKLHTIYIYRYNKIHENIYLGYFYTVLYLPFQICKLIKMKDSLN